MRAIVLTFIPFFYNIRTPPVSQEIPHPSANADSQDLIPSASQGGSQTQEETQPLMDTQPEEDPMALKRQTTTSSDEYEKDDRRKTKKVKISIGPPVDLGD